MTSRIGQPIPGVTNRSSRIRRKSLTGVLEPLRPRLAGLAATKRIRAVKNRTCAEVKGRFKELGYSSGFHLMDGLKQWSDSVGGFLGR